MVSLAFIRLGLLRRVPSKGEEMKAPTASLEKIGKQVTELPIKQSELLEAYQLLGSKSKDWIFVETWG